MSIVLTNQGRSTVHVPSARIHLGEGESIIIQETELTPEVDELISKGTLTVEDGIQPEEWSEYQIAEYKRMSLYYSAEHMSDIGLCTPNYIQGKPLYEYLMEKVPNKRPTIFFGAFRFAYIIVERLNSKMFHDVILPGLWHISQSDKHYNHHFVYSVKKHIYERTVSVRIFITRTENAPQKKRVAWEDADDWSKVILA